MAKYWQCNEVPLLAASDKDQWAFIKWVSSLMRGTVLYSTAADAATQFLQSAERLDYLFLIVENPLEGDLLELVNYYLDSRDILGSALGYSVHFKDYPIHLDHRLTLLVERQVLNNLPTSMRERLGELCSQIFIS